MLSCIQSGLFGLPCCGWKTRRLRPWTTRLFSCGIRLPDRLHVLDCKAGLARSCVGQVKLPMVGRAGCDSAQPCCWLYQSHSDSSCWACATCSMLSWCWAGSSKLSAVTGLGDSDVLHFVVARLMPTYIKVCINDYGYC